MSRDSLEKTLLILGTALAAGLVIVWQGLTFPWQDALSPLGLTCLLGGAAIYYQRQGTTNFVLCLAALIQITLYTACYSVLMYALATLDQPLMDEPLMAFDRLCGVHLPHIVGWSQSHEAIERLLQLAYNSLLWQTPLVIVLLGFTGDRLNLEGFVRQFLLSTLVCAVVFGIAPAAGPFAAYGYEPNATQARYLTHLHELREGIRTVVTWRGAEGLITFPSFHTCWAILLAWSVRGRWVTLVPSVIVNAAVVVSTLTTGWHYFADVLGGCVTAVVCIALSTVWAKQFEESTAEAGDFANGVERLIERRHRHAGYATLPVAAAENQQ